MRLSSTDRLQAAARHQHSLDITLLLLRTLGVGLWVWEPASTSANLSDDQTPCKQTRDEYVQAICLFGLPPTNRIEILTHVLSMLGSNGSFPSKSGANRVQKPSLNMRRVTKSA